LCLLTDIPHVMDLILSSNYFKLFELPVDFNIDEQQLTACYRQMQQAVHPDRYVNSTDQEKRLSVQHAATINEAYETLRDNMLRARYLLSLNGIDWDDERDTVMDAEFLTQQIEMREALGEVHEQSDPLSAAGDILDNVQTLIGQRTDRLSNCFERQDMQAASDIVRQLQFLYKLRQEAESLEAELEDAL